MTKLKNMLLSFLAIVVLAFIVTGTTILYSPVHEVSADSKHIHDGVEFQPWNSSNNLPYYSGFYYLTRDVSISEPWTPSIQVRLCLNGYKIYGPAYSLLSTDYTFKVKDATLYLYDEEGGAVLPNRSNPAKCSVNVYENSTFRMFGGTFQNQYIHVEEDGNFIMEGGTITGYNGYGVECEGNFTMNDGTISNNAKDGIYIDDYGTVVINGGNIINNSNNGIKSDGYVTINGGTISGNTYSGIETNRNVIMNGGLIQNNTEYGISSQTLTMSGGKITKNTLGGVYANNNWSYITSSSISLSKDAYIYDNTSGRNLVFLLNNSHVLSITEALTENALIGVTILNGNEPTTGVFTTYSYSTQLPINYIKNFRSDANIFQISSSENNLQIDSAHIHDGIEYELWTSETELPTSAGNYFICKDIILSSLWSAPAGTTRICLNRQTISASSDFEYDDWDECHMISVTNNSVLEIFDDYNTGFITMNSSIHSLIYVEDATMVLHGGNITTKGDSEGYNWYGITVVNGNFTMYDGNISGFLGNGILGYENSEIQVYGGTFTNNTSYAGIDRAGIKVECSRLTLSGEVTITNNNSGVYVKGSDFILSGKIIISGNDIHDYAGNIVLADYKDSDNNIHQSKITITDELEEGSDFGITLIDDKNKKTGGTFTNIAQGLNAENYIQFFHSDNPEYRLFISDNNLRLAIFKNIEINETQYGSVVTKYNNNVVNECEVDETILIELTPDSDLYACTNVSVTYTLGKATNLLDLVELMGTSEFTGKGEYSGYVVKINENQNFALYNGDELVKELSQSAQFEGSDDGAYCISYNFKWNFNLTDGKITEISIINWENISEPVSLFISADNQESNGTLPIYTVELTKIKKGEKYSFVMPCYDVVVTAVFETKPAPEYVAWDSVANEFVNLTLTAGYTLIDENASLTAIGSEVGKEWIVIEDSNAENGIILNNQITVNGTANIILMDDSFIQIVGGIVVNSGNTLNIYAQAEGTGKLLATSNGNDAGIGGTNTNSCGTIIVHGGTVIGYNNGNAQGIGTGAGGESNGTISVPEGYIVYGGASSGAHEIISAPYTTRYSYMVIQKVIKIIVDINDSEVNYNSEFTEEIGYTASIGGKIVTDTDILTGLSEILSLTTNYVKGDNVGYYELTNNNENYTEIFFTNTNSYQIETLNNGTIEVLKINPVLTNPTAKDVTYNGLSQELLNAGIVTGGTILYKSDGSEEYTTSIPKATDANTYTIYFKVVGDNNHNDIAEASIEAIVKNAILTDVSVIPTQTLVYNGESQSTQVSVSATAIAEQQVTFEYNATGHDEIDIGIPTIYSKEMPGFTDAGTHTVYFKASANNHDDYFGSFEVVIEKTESSFDTIPTGIEGLKYTGVMQELITNGTTTTGTVMYKLEGEEYSAEIPSATVVGTYTIYFKVFGDTNHNDTVEGSIQVKIGKAVLTEVSVVQNETLTYCFDEQIAMVDTFAESKNSEPVTFTYCSDENGIYGEMPGYTEPGTYTVYFKASAEYHEDYYGSFEVVIEKIELFILLHPQPVENLVYTGEEYELVNTKNALAFYGTFVYKIDDGEYSEELPVMADAGTYTIYYKLKGDEHFKDTEEYSFEVTIASVEIADVIVEQTGILIYNGELQTAQTLNQATTVNNQEVTFTYSELQDGTYGEMPTYIYPGTYTLYFKASANSHNDSFGSFEVIMEKANPVINVLPVAVTEMEYTSLPQELIVKGSATNGTLLYKLDYGEYSEDVPVATFAGVYTVYYKVTGYEHYNDIEENSLIVVITSVDKRQLTNKLAQLTDYYNNIHDDYSEIAEILNTAIKNGKSVKNDDNILIDRVNTEVERLNEALLTAQKDVFIVKLDNIGDVEYTSYFKTMLEELQDTYDNFTYEQKEGITNYENLVNAEYAYECLAADYQVANVVIDLIDAIGDVVYVGIHNAKIEDARQAYDALTDEQKLLVENYDALLLSEYLYKNIRARNELSVLYNEENGVKLEVNDDKTIPNYIHLNVELNSKTTINDLSEKYVNITDFIEQDKKISMIYNVKLVKVVDGVESEIQPSDIEEGMIITVRIEIPKRLKTDDLKVLHIHAENDMEFVEYTVENNEIVFNITRLSDFAFITSGKSDVKSIVIISVSGVIGVFILILIIRFVIRKKKYPY